MFRGRGKGSRGRSYHGGTVKKVPLKGLFADGIWKCNCDPRLPAQYFQTKNGGSNHGKWFYTCQKAKHKGCGFFLWDDDAKPREAAAVLSNSHTEPLPQTPQKPLPDSGGTPESPIQLRDNSPDIVTPYTPSRLSRELPPPSAPGTATRISASQASTTQDSDSEEEFYEWPASDDNEILHIADQASNDHAMPPPETPRKAVKTDALATPGKRKHENIESGWPTPSTGTVAGDVFTTPLTARNTKGLFANALPSPAETPTPIRYKDIPLTQASELTTEVLATLQTHNVALPREASEAISNICNKHVQYTRGIMKGRDVSRASVKARDERIAETQGEIEGLKAEREVDRNVIRHLKRDMAARQNTKR